MRPYVRLRLSSGQQASLGHGDLIGRLGSAALCLADPSVSEAHAMVSLRGHELMLLGLRGRFVCGGTPSTKLALAVGQEIHLSRDTRLTVEALVVPQTVLALEGDGLPRQVLAGVCSLEAGDGHLRLVSRYKPDASAWVFNVDGAWRVRLRGGGEARAMNPGDAFEVDGVRVQAVSVDLTRDAHNETCAIGAVAQPLRIVARYETVHIHRADDLAIVLTGLSARIISELVATRAPTPWETLAREVWADDESEPGDLRARFDAAMLRLRRKLRGAGVRGDLVRTDGHGSVELVAHTGDRIEDEG